MPLRPGETFGPFKIVDHLGRGGMGMVFKAFEPNPGRHVAVKVLPAEYVHDESFGERFRREARFIANLEHPNIVPLYEVGIDEGVPWMAMRLVAGGALSSLLRRQRLPQVRAVAILSGMAAALDYAHARKVIHRDVKPQNVLLDESGHVYLSDFGLARILEGGSLLQGGQSLTRGAIVGTPHYMAPEQAGGQTIDHRCDIYALGIVAYEMLAGRVPFTGDTPIQILMKHATEAVPKLSPADVPPALAEAVIKALAKEPAERWSSAGALIRELERGLQAQTGTATATLPSPPRSSPPAAVRPAPLTVRPARGPVQAPRQPARVEVGKPTVPARSRATTIAFSIAVLAAVVALGLSSFLVIQMRRSPQSVVTTPAPSGSATPSTTVPALLRDAAPIPLIVTQPIPHASSGTIGPASPATTVVAAPQPKPEAPRTRREPPPTTSPRMVETTQPGPTPLPPVRTTPTPAPPDGILRVVVIPWADVTVDGTPATTLSKIPLPAGAHTVRFVHPDYEPLQRRVTIRPGETYTLTVDLPEEAVKRKR